MLIANERTGRGFNADEVTEPNWEALSWVADDSKAVSALLAQCPAHSETPLTTHCGILNGATLSIKDETGRMGLGSFKALGAAFVIAKHADEAARESGAEWATALTGRTYVAASAGNHGLSVAAGARVFGANAQIILAETVPSSFADRLRAMGAEVIIHGADYAQSMAHAQELGRADGATLLSDAAWQGYLNLPWLVMQGYAQLAEETVRQMAGQVPTKIFLQAGVGGLAAACAAVFRKAWGKVPEIYVVEPEFAPAILRSYQERQMVFADGPVSNMGRLDCKEPSLLAFKSLVRDADFFQTISDEHAANTVAWLQANAGLASTPSGVGGLAGALADEVTLKSDDHVLVVVSEGVD